MGRSAALAFLVLISVGCGDRAPKEAPSSSATIGVASTCEPTDQDRYVYRPARLQMLMPCIRIAGTIVSSTVEADGDVHINVRLDPDYEGVLTTENREEQGNLIVEPVCQFPAVQAEAIRVCASDGDPLHDGLPAVGAHVFMEGRYVLDLQHHGWAELHPLYRWGRVEP